MLFLLFRKLMLHQGTAMSMIVTLTRDVNN
jgi:hypothetical protein